MWTRENTIVLIMLYEQCPQLYNVCNPAYKNKMKRKLCLQQISDELNSQCSMKTTVDIISKKINGLRTTFAQESNKIRKSKASGVGTDDIYQPTWWCFEHLLFLSDYAVVNAGESNLIMEPSEPATLDAHQAEELQIIFEDDVSEFPPLPNIQKNILETIQNKPQREEPPKKRLKTNSENAFFENANKVLTNMSTNKIEVKQIDDHIYRFAHHVETELRIIKEKNKLRKVKADISRLIYEAQEED